MLKLFKWFIKTVLLLTGILPLTRCSSGYKQKNGKITFNGKEITDKNFIILNDVFAKDSTTVWYKGYPFMYADIGTFEAVDDHYAKDKDKVYYCDEYREGQNYYLTKRQTILELKRALPASFISLNHGYAKDSLHAYFKGALFNVKDVKSLTSIDNHFAKDDVQAYLNLQPIAGSDGKTFEITDRNFAKDTAHIYYYGYTGEGRHNIAILPGDKGSFQVLDHQYSKDKTNVFFLGFTIKGADAPSWKILTEGYSKDKNAVYFKAKRIEGADATSFEVYKENGMYGHDVNYAKDNTSVYMDDKKLSAADATTFKVLGANYGSDSKKVFYKTMIVKDASPVSFKVYPHDFGNADAEDATSKFHEGKKVVDE